MKRTALVGVLLCCKMAACAATTGAGYRDASTDSRMSVDAVVAQDVVVDATLDARVDGGTRDPRCTRNPCLDRTLFRRGPALETIVVRPTGTVFALNRDEGTGTLRGGERHPEGLVDWGIHAFLTPRQEVVARGGFSSAVGGGAVPYRGVGLRIFDRGLGVAIADGRTLLNLPSNVSDPNASAEERYVLATDYRFESPIIDVMYRDNETTAVLLEDGSAYYMYRYSSSGPYPSRDDAGVVAPRRLPVDAPIAQLVMATNDVGAAVLRDGTVVEWGGSGLVLGRFDGHLGMPLHYVDGLRDIEKIAGGSNSSCALTRQHGVFCWGNSYHGQLGNGVVDLGSRDAYHPPGDPVSLPPVRDVIVGNSQACALTMGEEVYCWGDFRIGRVGDPNYAAFQPLPVRMTINE